jgi:Activator of Hsp90 ATPase homolog 1-like protein
MSSMQTGVEAVHKTLHVSCSPERAFEVFTRELESWWPKHTHSIGAQKIVEIVFEEHVGGRVFERLDNGEEGEWGRVLTWDPPRSFSMTWYPGQDASQATALAVRFASEGDGTRMDLEHTGWEVLGEPAAEIRGTYDSGWDEVLGYYTDLLR